MGGRISLFSILFIFLIFFLLSLSLSLYLSLSHLYMLALSAVGEGVCVGECVWGLWGRLSVGSDLMLNARLWSLSLLLLMRLRLRSTLTVLKSMNSFGRRSGDPDVCQGPQTLTHVLTHPPFCTNVNNV